MVNFKGLQNKAFHQGRYIAYAVAGEHQYTTNGHLMVRLAIDTEELKPLKDQIDMRVDGSSMADLTKVIEYHRDLSKAVVNADIAEEFTTDKGLKVTRVHGTADGIDITVLVQSVYIDYVVARFEDKLDWFVTERGLMASDKDKNVMAVIAKVEEQE